MSKKTILSASTTTGLPTLGNYLGAIRNWSRLQEDYECFYMVADLHSLTTKQDPKELEQRILTFYASYISCGLNPDKNVLFVQSHVSAHAELQWALNCLTPMGALGRMTQYKEKSQKTKELQAGLFNYPVLMAADILLYQAHLVPVGEDQKQHLELTRDLAQSFNSKYQEAFTVPEPYIAKVGAKIMSLQDPTKKMSKSDEDPKSFVSIFDTPKKIEKKIKSAVTDSEDPPRIFFDAESKQGVSNLLTIHSLLSGKSFEELKSEYDGKMYGHLKVDVAELVVETLKPVQEMQENLLQDPGHLKNLMKAGAERASARAEDTLKKVYQALGLVALNN